MKKLFLKLVFLFVICSSANVFSEETKQVKIYDCFPFFNELDLLEVRLHELYDQVDYFVLVENELTQSGLEKPFYFQDNKQRYAKYLDKIIRVVGKRNDKRPEGSTSPDDNWYRENAFRNDILLGLKDAKDDDIVIISDLDEIPKKEVINKIKDVLTVQKKDATRLELKMYRYFLNREDIQCPTWVQAIASTYKIVKEKSPEYMRTGYKASNVIRDAGWHFTDMGGIRKQITKLEACAHQDRNTKKQKDPYKILRKARKGKRVFIDNTYPRFICENLKYFKNKNYIDDNFPMNWNLRVFEKREKQMLREELSNK